MWHIFFQLTEFQILSLALFQNFQFFLYENKDLKKILRYSGIIILNKWFYSFASYFQ